MLKCSNKYYPLKLTFLFLLFVELASFYASFFPKFNVIVFFVISIAIFLISLTRLEYGVYALLAELFVGSKGYLFYFNAGGINISLRMALFAAIFAAWLIKLIRDESFRGSSAVILKKNDFIFFYILLFVVIGWGIINGILNGNRVTNIFLDANAWLFFGLIFIFLTVIISWKQIQNIFQILSAALLVLGLKSLVLLGFFSHNINSITPFLYKWSRIHMLAEITKMARNFYRVFSQAQIYSLIGFFLFVALLSIIINKKQKDGFRFFSKKWEKLFIYLCVILSSVTILISFSRSFWLGGIGALFILFWGLKVVLKHSWSKIFKLGGMLAIIITLEIGAVYILINYPKPREEAISFTTLLENRVVKSGTEKASMSRFNLLSPLMKKIFKNPILGSGFGTTVSYKSLDPRNIGESPDDLYTTYAFEWGYLDIWLKIGLVGLTVYLFLIWKIWKQGWGIVKFSISNSQFSMNKRRSLVFGMLVGLMALLVTHIASPYLNHPLGIGYTMLCSAIFSVIEINKNQKSIENKRQNTKNKKHKH